MFEDQLCKRDHSSTILLCDDKPAMEIAITQRYCLEIDENPCHLPSRKI